MCVCMGYIIIPFGDSSNEYSNRYYKIYYRIYPHRLYNHYNAFPLSFAQWSIKINDTNCLSVTLLLQLYRAYKYIYIHVYINYKWTMYIAQVLKKVSIYFYINKNYIKKFFVYVYI